MDRTIVTPDALPTAEPPEDLDAIVKWSAWTAWAVATGKIDPVTAREMSHSLQVAKTAEEKRTLLRRLRTLERVLAKLASSDQTVRAQIERLKAGA